MRTLCSRFNRQRGTAAVEFAILLGLILALGFGAVEYGRAVYQYNNVVKSVRSAVRMLSQYNPTDSGYAARKMQAQCMAVYGTATCIDGSEGALVPGLTLSHIKICDSVSSSDCDDALERPYKNVDTDGGKSFGTINLVSVRLVGYEFPLLGLPVFSLIGSPPHDASATVPFGPIEAVMRQAG